MKSLRQTLHVLYETGFVLSDEDWRLLARYVTSGQRFAFARTLVEDATGLSATVGLPFLEMVVRAASRQQDWPTVDCFFMAALVSDD